MIREIKSYRWGQEDAPVKTEDHSLDELRYYIMTRPHTANPKEVLTDVQLDKKKLISKLRRERRNYL